MLNDIQTNKIEEAYKVLRLAAEMSKTYYEKPLIITYSGGKDSDVLVQLAFECLDKKDFEIFNSHTTVDAPETVYYIRERFKEWEKVGVKCTVHMPHYKDGRPMSMWSLIVDKQIPPTRIQRYCCTNLKEITTQNRFVAVGVRAAESINRRGRDFFSFRGTRKDETHWYSLDHTEEVYRESLDFTRGGAKEESPWDCLLIVKAKQNKDLICNPIYKFTDTDVWDFIHDREMKYNPLYDQGWTRVGCVGCPMATNQLWEFEKYPKYKQLYIKAFERMIERRKAAGKVNKNDKVWKDGESVFKWWTKDYKQIEGQMSLFDEENNK